MPVSAIQFTSVVTPLEHLKMYYLVVPRTVVTKVGTLKKRWLCTVDGSFTWPCGLVALGGGRAYISLNKKIMKVLDLRAMQKVKVRLAPDKSRYGMEVPPELKALLKQDKEGNRRFNMLVPGKQRYIIYYVSQVKGTQLRIDRAVRLIENLKRTRPGKESFREILAK